MSIFKRGDQGNVKQAAAVAESSEPVGDPQQSAKAMPPGVSAGQVSRAAAPGVVPPPAAPIYSMRLPQPGSDGERGSSANGDTQHSTARVQAGVRVDLQRTRTSATPARGVPRRPTPQSTPAVQPARQQFDPLRAAQTGLLNLAWRWQEAGSPIRAIHAYVELLNRYPDSAAAAAAVSDLVELSDKLAGEGQFHTALAIYDHLEQWALLEEA